MRLTLRAVLLTYACLAWAGGPGTIEKIGALTDSGAPQSIRNVLEPGGTRVLRPDGSTLCELWLRANVPAQNAGEVQGAVFPQLAEPALLGVISANKGFGDYRGQSIKPGLYTLRYSLLPNDGNHVGVAPSRDFVLLAPIASDGDPNAKFSPSELVKLSRQASATQHPAPMSLVQPEGTAFPSLTSDFEGHIILAVKLKIANAELPIGIVVNGAGQQ